YISNVTDCGVSLIRVACTSSPWLVLKPTMLTASPRAWSEDGAEVKYSMTISAFYAINMPTGKKPRRASSIIKTGPVPNPSTKRPVLGRNNAPEQRGYPHGYLTVV